MSWLYRGLTYCRQLAVRQAIQSQAFASKQQSPALLKTTDAVSAQVTTTRCCSSESKYEPLAPTYKFKTKSPYKNPGPRRYGHKQMLFDGGPLPRGLEEPIRSLKKYIPKNRWTEEAALFGRNDYIDLLSDSDIRPVDLLKCPAWLKGFNGNEMQRLVRRMNVEGHKIKQLYPTHYYQNQKRIRYLYKKYNQKRGKRMK